MGCENFSVGSIRQHLDGIHAPRVMYEGGVLMVMGRRIPVINREQLAVRLDQIGVEEDVAEQIVGELFGYRVATKASVAIGELVESLV